ncbi:Aliphatic sulfonates import ATP-binding protein SsuB [Fundidesulfovibrio magnetotacticus]|uniref:Aliphatic sulfonates import ATP-binding protein SsuB n=1 Tax=Fundidesulfovibrio magnetotacticus TaxID=2730080 RepID=A0A6V8LSE2_9BACT|nr:ABC transporter ATP-binding protein [Fundidesulfovibrio magnetotacticus]GFK95393.1 Aliphatic sulfonates import ATP-binding protein SsuB [Fundidesulfovibrio magnetotacticus]
MSALVTNTAPGAPLDVVLRGVGKRFPGRDGEVLALTGIDLDVRHGEFLCILGPSGCGKSTLLNAIAGFALPYDGAITANGVPVVRPGPDRAMVFQEYAIFPWMTVAQNVAFGLKIKGLPRTEIEARVDALLRKFQLQDFRDRFPKHLSGGMRQRVAIARVLALDSPMLLMDEPFGALDALTRRNLQDELLRIWMECGKTVLFVTHSIEESIVLANRVVVMTYRPGTIKRVVPVEMPYPRDPASPRFAELARELSGLVMEEQMRHEQAERAAGDGPD